MRRNSRGTASTRDGRPRAAVVLLLATLVGGCSPAGFFATIGRATPSPLGGAFIGGRMGQEVEPPLETGGGIHAVSPDPHLLHPANMYFSSHSRTFLWLSDSGDTLMAAELDGQARELAPYNRSGYMALPPLWSADGRSVIIRQYPTRPRGGYAEGLPLQAFRIGLQDGASSVIGTIAPDWYLDAIPDGSGIWTTRPIEASQRPPDVMNNEQRNLYVQLPGQAATVELAMGGPGFGSWSPDGQAFAYFEYPNQDPRQGMDLRLYDRQSKASRTVHHLDSNPFTYGPPNFQWSGRRLAFSVQAPPDWKSLTVHSVNVDDGQSQVRTFTLPLGANDVLNKLVFSPDLEQVAYEVSETVAYQSGKASGTRHESRGIRVFSLSDSQVVSLSPRGRIVCWLPGGQDLIATTGREDDTRFYRIDVPAGTGKQ